MTARSNFMIITQIWEYSTKFLLDFRFSPWYGFYIWQWYIGQEADIRQAMSLGETYYDCFAKGM